MIFVSKSDTARAIEENRKATIERQKAKGSFTYGMKLE